MSSPKPANFAPCLANLLVREGGYANNPHDPGGSTNLGITQAVLNAWRVNHPLAPMSVISLTSAIAGEIYKFQYWDPVQGDLLPAGVDNCVFDESANSGPVQAGRDLQHGLNRLGAKLVVDGHIGAMTLAAAAKVDPAALINAVCDYRLSFMGKLKNWRWFKNGWINRVRIVRQQSLAMVRA